MTRPAPDSFPFRIDFSPALPISARAEEIVAAIQSSQVVILAGETGSGKTTQIPKMCLAAGRGTTGRIACTQPRRVAAQSISRRVAEELGVAWGREVGCKIRFSDQTTASTVIKFLTDGMLLAEVQGDPMLREYDTIIIDEAHERSLNIDFLLGHLRTLRHRRPDLKIIVTSATIDTAAFSKAFDDAPVIQVEGRMFPVELIYAPLDSLERDFNESAEDGEAKADVASAKAEAMHYIDGAVEAVERIVRDSADGDVLVFMPSERDIRETTELLEGRMSGRDRRNSLEVVPLFGRLSNSEQQRVFAPSQRRKIIIATNIAETSLTIPGIRFVVDTGLSRLSRYSPLARTRRLPIEPIAQSSADQRKGRCGRVSGGVCIRLYSEADYLERPRFTQPEIQRANLADVILRMMAFGLGDIERFPFLNMPATKSIRAGYALLEELGAIGSAGPTNRESRVESREDAPNPSSPHSAFTLTPVGRELARLPVDPTVGRMILQARSEKAVREVAIIAAGLSIQDPRERPLEKQKQADAAHRRFAHRDSDFLTLLNIWDSSHGEFETMSQSHLRRFCRDHFLSYTRMREWRDIYAQLLETLGGRDDFKFTSAFDGLNSKGDDADKALFGTPPYRAIHRSILAGLLGNIARLDEESGVYKATHDRKVNLFPGSVLFVRNDPKRKKDSPKSASKARAPRWILASEIVETTRIYARTCARLDPAWALDLGAHLVRVAHSEPFWDPEMGRVLVKQRTRLYGLELETRAVGYGAIDPGKATEIFVREGLVNDTISWPFDFIAYNRKLREQVEAALTRTRDTGYLNLDEAAYHFYANRLRPKAGLPAGVSSVAELVDLVRERRGAEPKYLMMAAGDLRDPSQEDHDPTAFPVQLPLGNQVLSLAYAYKPGQGDDGVTLDVGIREAEALTPAALDWAVPGHLEQKVEHYLRVLPKELRRGFVPLGDTSRKLSALLVKRDRLTDRRETIAEALAAQIRESYSVAIDLKHWLPKPPPDHLRVRVRVLDDEGRELCASRELSELRSALDAHKHALSETSGRNNPDAWRRARATWEKSDQTIWTFGDIPVRVQLGDQAGVPVFAFPGLRAGVEGVALRLFKTPEEAVNASHGGVSALLELQLRHDLGWMQRDLKALRELGALTATIAPIEALKEDAFQSVRRWLCAADRVPMPANEAILATASQFSAALESAKSTLRGLVPKLVDLLREILSLRQSLLVHPQPYPGLEKDLAALLPSDFLRTSTHPRLTQFPRYLKGMALRADRWRKNPAKDAERAGELAPFVAASRAGNERLRWLAEEFRVSLFAQELGTAEPVSLAKLQRALAESKTGAAAAPPAPELPPARLPMTKPERKDAPLKNFGALDNLFRR